MAQPQTIIFWGSGATAELGIGTTTQQAQFIRCVTGAKDPDQQLEERVVEVLRRNDAERWHDALLDLITILGDSDEAYDHIDVINHEHLNAMRRNWRKGATDEELRRRILDLRLIYDWPALKSVVRICPGSATSDFKLNDLFNLLDMHIPPGFGFRAPSPHGVLDPKKHTGEQFFDARRLVGAKNALLMILIASFYIDYQACISSKRDLLQKYYDFVLLLGRRMQNEGLHLASESNLDRPKFYKGDVGFASLNYDPILLWLQFNTNRELNKSATVPHIGSPAVPLHLFHDFGHLIPARRIERPEADWPWYPMNEGAVQRLNEQAVSDSRVRLTKFLFPHGCLCWRECPDCGKLSAYHGDRWGLDSSSLFPPPPLQAFEGDESSCPDWITGKEREQRELGRVDARACLHCGTLTYAHHTQAIMQSSFKPRPPSFIEEIQRDLRATAMQASHIIFMGYSLPVDDVTYRAFFSASRQRGGTSGHEFQSVRCTVVDKDDDNHGWYGPSELEMKIKNLPETHPAKAARDIFDPKYVRYYDGGIPNVFLDDGRASVAALERLLNWSSTV